MPDPVMLVANGMFYGVIIGMCTIVLLLLFILPYIEIRHGEDETPSKKKGGPIP